MLCVHLKIECVLIEVNLLQPVKKCKQNIRWRKNTTNVNTAISDDFLGDEIVGDATEPHEFFEILWDDQLFRLILDETEKYSGLSISLSEMKAVFDKYFSYVRTLK